jgi:hypothetical protein
MSFSASLFIYPAANISIGTFLHKLWLFALLIICIIHGNNAHSQIVENVEVEIYYIINENDVASPGLEDLPLGTKVYRVFVELCDGCKLKSIFGDANHILRLESTEAILNSPFGSSFAHNITGSLFPLIENAAMDSYISLGAASNGTYGIPKQDDADGSIWQGRVPPQPLTNDDVALGIGLPISDGLLSSQGAATIPSDWFPPDNQNEINEVFGNQNNGLTIFSSNNTSIQTITGVEGIAGTNKFLIAQITTTGDLAFNINLEVITAEGNVVRVVGTEPLLEGEVFSPYLFYPPVCGCTDPNFLEFDVDFTCDDGSCLTEIIFGCLNEDACNFSTTANFDVPELCCFPDSCQGLDISILCPLLPTEEVATTEMKVFPNPSSGDITLEISNQMTGDLTVMVYDLTGRVVWQKKSGNGNQSGMVHLNLNHLNSGTYIVQVFDLNTRLVKLFEILR